MTTWFYTLICIPGILVYARHTVQDKDVDIDTQLEQILKKLLQKNVGHVQRQDDVQKEHDNAAKQRNVGHVQRQDDVQKEHDNAAKQRIVGDHVQREDEIAKQHIEALEKDEVDPDSELMKLISSFQVYEGNKIYKADHLNPEDSGYNKAQKLDKHRLTHEQKVQLLMESEKVGEKNIEGDVLKRGFTTRALWTKKTVPYKIDDSLKYKKALDVIHTAMDIYSKLTCIKWKPHTLKVEKEVGHSEYVEFYSGSGCTSYVGRWVNQDHRVSLSSPGCIDVGTALHEMLHTLGQYHEQQRTDRDNHVRFIWETFGMNYKGDGDYGKFGSRDRNPYDYESIMHYGWSKGFEPLQPELGFLAESGSGLSFYDVEDITDAYKCTENCVNHISCENGGFLDFKCSCYCPYGLTGDKCDSVINSAVCGGIIDLIPGEEVTITTPNYPKNYDVNTECVWLLRAPASFHVRVDVDVLHLPEDTDNNRCYHWLEVRYNLVGQTGVRKCGHTSADTWVTSPWGEKNLMLLIFNSVFGKLHFPERGFALRARPVRDGCIPDPCVYGVCKDCDSQDYKCSCDPGFEGERCDKIEAFETVECKFEENRKCFLENIENDQFDWTIYSGATVSDLTGPDEALEGKNYMYAEVSTPRKQGDKAILESDLEFAAEDRCLEFAYNMFGAGIGALRVKSNSEELWSKSGNQGFGWHLAKVTIPRTDNLKISLEAERGNDWEGDIAIDDIKLSPGECGSPASINCIDTAKGKDYKGTDSVTKGGITCQRWDTPHQHSYHDYDKEENYCRNTKGDADRPWCYTIYPDMSWDYCNIPHCHIQECVRSKNGYDYLGTKAVTKLGLPCDDDKPCRGGGNKPAPWCKTSTDPNVAWDTCDVPKCAGKPKECLQTPTGIDYFGTASVTNKGSTCQRWDSQVPNQHDYWYMDDQENYCRNPGGSTGPWCYSTVPGEKYGHCDISYCDVLGCNSDPCLHGGTCKDTENGGFACQCRVGYEGTTCQTRATDTEDCKRSAIGYEYQGKISVTADSYTCQRWELDVPHAHEYNSLPENYCRNPGKFKSPWCYTTDTNKEYDTCDVPFCTTPPKECLESEKGSDYFGSVRQTRDGFPCQKWSEQTPHTHTYDYIKDQDNFCRNPYGEMDRPWCYTTDPDKIWQYCDIPHC